MNIAEVRNKVVFWGRESMHQGKGCGGLPKQSHDLFLHQLVFPPVFIIN